mgnify:CR=1 FL=1
MTTTRGYSSSNIIIVIISITISIISCRMYQR